MAVHLGGVALPAAFSARLVELTLPGHTRLPSLTGREVQVLALIGAGSSPDEIATALVLSEGTVRAHLEHLRTKLAARNRAQLAIIARDTGLSPAPAPAPAVKPATGHRQRLGPS